MTVLQFKEITQSRFVASLEATPIQVPRIFNEFTNCLINLNSHFSNVMKTRDFYYQAIPSVLEFPLQESCPRAKKHCSREYVLDST